MTATRAPAPCTAKVLLQVSSFSIFFLAPAALASTDVARLNRVTFGGNVLTDHKEGEGPESWVVMFCADWFEPCQEFTSNFKEAAVEHGGASADLFSREMRFAEVDCAVDKVLCNTQGVDMYPTVVYYRHGAPTNRWISGGRSLEADKKSFKKWVETQTSQVLVADDAEATKAEADTKTATWRQGVPLDQMIPVLVFMSAGAVWLYRMTAELQQGLQVLREVSADREKEKALPVVVEQEEVKDGIAVVRSLPEHWAGKKGFTL